MKNINLNVKEKLIAKYLIKDQPKYKTRSTNINVLLNRIQLNKKNESRKKGGSNSSKINLILFVFSLFIYIIKSYSQL